MSIEKLQWLQVDVIDISAVVLQIMTLVYVVSNNSPTYVSATAKICHKVANMIKEISFCKVGYHLLNALSLNPVLLIVMRDIVLLQASRVLETI